jgi:hypothetical protein
MIKNHSPKSASLEGLEWHSLLLQSFFLLFAPVGFWLLPSSIRGNSREFGAQVFFLPRPIAPIGVLFRAILLTL